MSTISSAVFAESDDERDADFVPEDESESGDEEMPITDAQPEQDPAVVEAQKAEKEKTRESLWESFQASVAAASGTSSTNVPKQVNLVKVERKYRFAGEEVSEIIEVPEDSEDAKKWPRWIAQARKDATSSNEATHETGRTQSQSAAENVSRTTQVAAASALPTKSVPTASSSSAKPAPRQKPGPRKPKTLLMPLPSGKPKKLTTLEKSAMDWRAHVSQTESTGEAPCGGESIADELERNRRGGGFLEKVAFLERVENRREELFDESRKKRRKG